MELDQTPETHLFQEGLKVGVATGNAHYMIHLHGDVRHLRQSQRLQLLQQGGECGQDTADHVDVHLVRRSGHTLGSVMFVDSLDSLQSGI